jgi:hypothetical protein
MLTELDYLTLRETCKQVEGLMRARVTVDLQFKSFARDGLMPEVTAQGIANAMKGVKQEESRLLREVGLIWKTTPIGEWVERTGGLGSRVYWLLGLLPPIWEIANPAKIWKLCGLHPDGAKRPAKGEFLGYSRRLKSYALIYVGEPCMKVARKIDGVTVFSSPFRVLYDNRRTHTEITHPSMLAEGEGCEFCDLAYSGTRKERAEHAYERERKTVGKDCANRGGVHWKDGHRHADALRYMTKAILRDAWKVAHNQEPTHGGNHA